MPAYDGIRFEPPAPIAEVTLRNSASREAVHNVPMLIDSGSDLTLLPEAVASALGSVVIDESYKLTAFDGSTTTARAVEIDLLFLGRNFRGRFALIDQAWGILGRNILNHLKLIHDGPAAKWEEYRP